MNYAKTSYSSIDETDPEATIGQTKSSRKKAGQWSNTKANGKIETANGGVVKEQRAEEELEMCPGGETHQGSQDNSNDHNMLKALLELKEEIKIDVESLHKRMVSLDRHIQAIILNSEMQQTSENAGTHESDYYNPRKTSDVSSNSSESLHCVPKRLSRLTKSSKVSPSPHILSPTQSSSPQHHGERNNSHESLTQESTASGATVMTTIDIPEHSTQAVNSQRKDKMKNIDIL